VQQTQTTTRAQTPSTAQPAPFVVDPRMIPRTADEVRALRIKIDDLHKEQQDAASRRANIAGRLDDASPPARAGYEARLAATDRRLLQIESDLTEATAALARADARAIVESVPPSFADVVSRLDGDEIAPLIAILAVFIFAPFSIALSRFIWRRGAGQTRAAVDQAVHQRLDELQQSVDTIAIEVERISEGQRFVTRMLSDSPAVGAGQAEPVHAARKSVLPDRR
jgi:hypothetical protein